MSSVQSTVISYRKARFLVPAWVVGPQRSIYGWHTVPIAWMRRMSFRVAQGANAIMMEADGWRLNT
ncbi:uncharacterized protein MEPE_05778 [Melanopsichium pennsylvanicum]|uniref:Uncharacterized protein n=1 Tax=Melanopsichium pennsylvanicum TaxID=63383 RepID=A0AAJ4XTR4_9BASI|nr:uncharacterized protein MEPE_05778 [Melanopsichium pennsylvanicum]